MMSDGDLVDEGTTDAVVDADLGDVETVTSVVHAHISDHNEGHIAVVTCAKDDLMPESALLNASGNGEPAAKRIKLDEDSLLHMSNSNVSIKQILFNINHAICLRLDAIENKLESVSNASKILEHKMEQLSAAQNSQATDVANTSLHNSSITKEASISSPPCGVLGKKGGAVVVGLPQTSKTSPSTPGDLGGMLSDDECDGPERYVVNLAGSNNLGANSDQAIQNLGPNVTLITLNSEEDFPTGTWLGDESNLEMRVRVPVTPSDLLHIHSNCRTAEKMALTLLDYLFDRETQAYSNLSGMGKHGKKQLDPLMIYGIRCHLIHHFNITEQDWHRIKQNINSKCRTAFRRKVRGLPLTVKAFRGKAPPTYIHISGTGLTRVHAHDLGDTSDDSFQHADDTELQIQTEVGVSQAGLLAGTNDIIQSAAGQIQVLHATPEQVAQLQQTHQIQILQGDQILQFQTGDSHESIHVAVPMGQNTDGIQVINSENGDTIHLGSGTVITDVTQEMGHQIPKVEVVDSDQ